MKNATWIIVLVLLLGGCKARTIYVPLETVKVEHKDRVRIDSVFFSDTTTIYHKGDTLYLEKIKWRTRHTRDTVSHVKTDSIPYPVEVPIITNELTKWQKIRLDALNVLAIVIGVLGAFKLGRFFNK